MDDREVVAAIAAGDPAGIAVAYDTHAAALYGYCHWILQQPADAAEALKNAFVIAVATLDLLPETPKLRPWLYAVARDECLRRLRAEPGAHRAEADAAGHPAAAADGPADVSRDTGPAELATMIRVILAELKPREREVLELSLRHDLYGADLATVLGVSWSRAHALAARARGRLEKALGALLIAYTGREACPTLDTLLADWDGQPDENTRMLVGGHIEHCVTCAARKRGALRSAALVGLLPQAALPPGLREQVLRLCSGTAPDAVVYRRRVARRAASTWPARFSQARRLLKRGHIRGNGRAAVILAMWIVAVWGVGLALLAFGHSHHSRTVVPRAAVKTLMSSPAVTPITSTSASAASRPSPRVSSSASYVRPSRVPRASPTVAAEPSPSPSRSPKPSRSPSPKPSRSPSPKPSKSPSPSPSRKPSPSPSSSSSPSTTG